MNFRVKLHTDATLNNMDGRSVIYSSATGDFYGLNDTATVMVDELLQSDFESTVRESARRYEMPDAEIARDLREVVDTLIRLHLVEKEAL